MLRGWNHFMPNDVDWWITYNAINSSPFKSKSYSSHWSLFPDKCKNKYISPLLEILQTSIPLRFSASTPTSQHMLFCHNSLPIHAKENLTVSKHSDCWCFNLITYIFWCFSPKQCTWRKGVFWINPPGQIGWVDWNAPAILKGCADLEGKQQETQLFFSLKHALIL